MAATGKLDGAINLTTPYHTLQGAGQCSGTVSHPSPKQNACGSRASWSGDHLTKWKTRNTLRCSCCFTYLTYRRINAKRASGQYLDKLSNAAREHSNRCPLSCGSRKDAVPFLFFFEVTANTVFLTARQLKHPLHRAKPIYLAQASSDSSVQCRPVLPAHGNIIQRVTAVG
ncbi:hypothetical protein CEXT_657621 [Caerostris extrusa]|uniref:Uncharacterized protein n=1 Tax=Caerostris extrusa TaxID=172846 RepID=A0AAV4M3E2_CAEEX|nr:hypothetical protein CEXT_657621 [Caerostris extrusa]